MTNEFTRKKITVPLRSRLKSIGRLWYMAVIVALIPVLLAFQMRDQTRGRFTGVVDTESETVGAIANARIVSVDVQPGQRVNAGDVLVRLDPADRNLDLAMQEARLLDVEQSVMQYEQGLLRYRETLQESERRCRSVVEEASVALEAEKMNRVRDQAELSSLKAEVARLQPLVEKRLVSEMELSSLRPKIAALEQTLTQYAPLIEALQKRCELANKDLKEVGELLASLGQPATEARKESMRRLTQAYQQTVKNDPCVLKASRAGVVSRVQRQAGDVVKAGDPIVRVASLNSMYITGLLSQQQLVRIAVGDRLQVYPLGDAGRSPAVAQVEAVDPEVLDLLDPFNPVPRFSVRGRRVRLRVLDEAVGLVPGETVSLQPVNRETWRESVRKICFFSSSRASSL